MGRKHWISGEASTKKALIQYQSILKPDKSCCNTAGEMCKRIPELCLKQVSLWKHYSIAEVRVCARLRGHSGGGGGVVVWLFCCCVDDITGMWTSPPADPWPQQQSVIWLSPLTSGCVWEPPSAKPPVCSSDLQTLFPQHCCQSTALTAQLTFLQG